eukprot:CAMPEP_0171181106 /NCGR_PEP_ID=MMETSP0790-20130122/14093_1 /TAXON_ID=2925 /ORGANISM="Alexandrium catenella, Strain OF101" /LENGTH=130 /DNA_ID=CAMNT_0011646043 /DNA_START=70 /DNA_END=462 /DNA_ORIENTATION=-
MKPSGVLAVAVLATLAVSAVAERTSSQLRKRSSFTVNDQVFVDGALFSEGSGIEGNIGCHEHKGTSSFRVCGCGVKVVAHLLTECQGYKQYDEQVGTCDCSQSACDEKMLTTGYSKPFEWKAASFEISPC